MKRLVDSVRLDALRKALSEEGCVVPQNLDEEVEKMLRILSWRLKPRRQEQDVGFENMGDMSKAVRHLFQTDVYRYQGWFANESNGIIRLWSPEFYSPNQRAKDEAPKHLAKACEKMRRKRDGAPFSPKSVLETLPKTLKRKQGPEKYVYFSRKTKGSLATISFDLGHKKIPNAITTIRFADNLLLLKDEETAYAAVVRPKGRLLIWNRYVTILFSNTP